MTTMFMIILFIGLFISFYINAILFMKVSKFDELEAKQKRLMDEMDNAIGAYLSEVKDENDKLIDEIALRMQELEQQPTRQKEEKKSPAKDIPIPVPIGENARRQFARRSYKSTQQSPTVVDDLIKESEAKLATSVETDPGLTEDADERTQIVQLAAAGKSIEEIAKALGKGKTEVELILKFN